MSKRKSGQQAKNKSFVESVLSGDAGINEIDDYIEAWHSLPDDSSEAGQELHEFLGMTWDEYRLWVERPESIRFTLAARKAGRSVGEVLAAVRTAGVAARSSEAEEAEQVLDWLIERKRVAATIREGW
jgi:hypothetical protein